MTKPDLTIQDQLQQESGVISWQDLVRHFARGVLIKVDASLDLIAVAAGFAEDNSQQVQLWLEQGLIARASDEDARQWTAEEPDFTCVVAAPWVLAQIRPSIERLH